MVSDRVETMDEVKSNGFRPIRSITTEATYDPSNWMKAMKIDASSDEIPESASSRICLVKQMITNVPAAVQKLVTMKLNSVGFQYEGFSKNLYEILICSI